MEDYLDLEANLAKTLFLNVSNTKDVRQLIFSKNLPLCLIKPKYIVDQVQLSIAITKAIYNEKEGTMVTRSFPTEIIYCLSPTKNISESLKIFSSEDGDTEFLLIGEESLATSIRSSITGEEHTFASVINCTDIEAIRQVYKIPDKELEKSTLINSIRTRIATKEFS